ncbi:hypothetical protein FRC02_006034 [Tulasnella sp. 418]|nr:hypothetical protein FRC02_006034 [Tulasnella sp. 418]
MGAGVNLFNPEIISTLRAGRTYAEIRAHLAEKREKALGNKNQHTSTYSSPAAIRRWPAEKKPLWDGTVGYAVAFLSLLIFLAFMGL